ncbi:MAG: hypothetical protein KC656_38070 [Myxococcales bacterium]|nr:hypothetical protein [Myxococcales bacterium]
MKKSGCGCTTMGDPRGAAFFLLALFALRRRRFA